MGSPSARCRWGAAFAGPLPKRFPPRPVPRPGRRWLTGATGESCVFLASRDDAGYPRFRPAIAPSVPAPTLGRLPILLVDDVSPHGGESRQSPLHVERFAHRHLWDI